MIELPQADEIRKQMAQAALANVVSQLTAISDSALVNSKDLTVRIKISDGMQKDCDACDKPVGKGGCLELNTGSSSGGRAHSRIDWSNLYADISGQSNTRFICAAKFSSTSDVDAVIGITDNIQPTSNINGTLTTDHAAFIIDDAILYASVADGTTQQRSDISSGITLTDVNNYYIEKTGSNYAFYVNGTLRHTSSANNPNSGLDLGVCGIRTNAAAIKQLDITAPIVTFDI